MSISNYFQSRCEIYKKIIHIHDFPMLKAEAKIKDLRDEVELIRRQEKTHSEIKLSLLDLAAYLAAWAELIQQEDEK